MEGVESSAQPVFLVGMMGSGKSSVGPALADRLGRSFADSDALVEARAGLSIAEIFSQLGEGGFRALERQAIEKAAVAGSVIALGGGAVAQPGAALWLARLGVVVYLRASVPALLERLGDARQRPLLAGRDVEGRRQRLEELFTERAAAYESAAIVVDTDGLAIDEVAAEIEQMLARGEAG